MDKTQKILTSLLWGVLVVAMVTIIGLGMWFRWVHGSTDALRGTAVVEQAKIEYPAPDFALTNQAGRTVTSDQLRGEPYIAAFIFTHCAGNCPLMTQQMVSLEQAAPAGVRLITFTVDAERDTPEVLKDYAARFGADPARWHFLTGTQEQLDNVARGMKVASMKAADGSDQFIHSEKFLLVDAAGTVVGAYSSNEEGELKKLASDAAALAAKAGGPS